MRLDKWLVENKIVSSREKAKELIISKAININNELCLNASYVVMENDQIDIDRKAIDPYVSRSAHKLLAALNYFKITVKDKMTLDIGMSTGGFTQVLLENGAKKVFGVDVGHDQLHPSLKNDSRVEYREGINVRDGLPFVQKFDLVVVDVSFISVLKILNPIIASLNSPGELLILIKPQFEQNDQEKKMILNEKESFKIAKNCRENLIKQNFKCSDLFLVPLKGKEGNQEYFIKCDF